MVPELLAVLDTEGGLSLVRRDGSTLRLRACSGSDGGAPRIPASWYVHARDAEPCRSGELEDMIDAFIGRNECVHD
jgi:hypothetical protein